MENRPFIEGMRAYKPSPNAPDFIKANIVFKVDEISEFLEAHAKPDGTVRAVLKESRDGKLYAQLDHSTATEKPAQTETATDEDVSSSIPF